MKRQKKEPQWFINQYNYWKRPKKIVYISDSSDEQETPKKTTSTSETSNSNKNKETVENISTSTPSVTTDCSNTAQPSSSSVSRKNEIKKLGLRTQLNL